ncbi:MAG: aconitate hydratase AcnA [Burkholderiaceae bacterium]
MAEQSNPGVQLPWGVLNADAARHRFVDLHALFGDAERLARAPYTLRLLVENIARGLPRGWATRADVDRLVSWRAGDERPTLALHVSRVVLPDSSGLPVLLDLATLRSTLAREGGEPARVQPSIPVDLVIDHSLIVDHHGRRDALVLNMKREFERNAERYRFFKWAQQAFDGVRVVPPGIGIIHQVHLERLARVVDVDTGLGDPAGAAGADAVVHPEFVLGGDSHTPMVNGLGVLGWGVGGVEIEAAMLGEPYLLQLPRIVGVRLSGALRPGVTTTDLVLTVTERLRAFGVVDTIVEFGGPGCAQLSVPDRATVANMAPEYGATAAYFPIDAQTLDYLRATGRPPQQVALIEAYTRANALFREAGAADPEFDDCIELDLGEIEACVAGPRRPQDRVPLAQVAAGFRRALTVESGAGGFGLDGNAGGTRLKLDLGAESFELGHGALAIAAITACTNTSNPSVMLAAGLLARRAADAGLRVPGYVKTSLAPGSRVVTRYLERSGLLESLERLGFFVVGYGCTTCSGKSGPLVPQLAELIEREGLVTAAVVSSNRNFTGRIHRQVPAAYLASPPLVVAYALAGRIDRDLTSEPLGTGSDGRPVFLRDLWPERAEIDALLAGSRDPQLYRDNYEHAYEGTAEWRELPAAQGELYSWDPASTYIVEPPFFSDPQLSTGVPAELREARALAVYGDSLTTDHISPAGEIPAASEAGRYLSAHGVTPSAFNAFTMRRGNHHVMMRGTFANPRTHNRLVPDAAGGATLLLPQQRVCSVFDAAEAYRAADVPVIVLGGKDYGMGSSRDWAAKGPRLLGIRAVIAESFERIHRANLVALGIVPLLFGDGDSIEALGLSGRERFDLLGLREAVLDGGPVRVVARPDSAADASAGRVIEFLVRPALASRVEAQLLEGGGIFARVAAKLRDAPAAGAYPSHA